MTVKARRMIDLDDTHLLGVDELDPGVSSQKPSGLRLLERSLAYGAACSLIESSCAPVGDGWFDRSDFDPHAAGPVADALLYLNLRDLLEQHPDEPAWVALRDESEEL